MQVKVMGFEILREFYKDGPYFKEILEKCESCCHNHFLLRDDYFFKVNHFEGHFGRDKTITLELENFYCKKMNKYVRRYIEHYKICHIIKSQVISKIKVFTLD